MWIDSVGPHSGPSMDWLTKNQRHRVFRASLPFLASFVNLTSRRRLPLVTIKSDNHVAAWITHPAS